MEILGDDEAGLPTPPPRRSPFAGELALDGPDAVRRNGASPAGTPTHEHDVDLDHEGDPDAGHAPTGGGPDGAAPVGRARLLLDTVAGPEALGIAGLVTAVTGIVTTGISPFVLVFRPDGMTGVPGQSLQTYYAPVVLAFGAMALALGTGAVLRVRPTSPAWVRGVAGATVLVAALMLAAAGWGLWNAPPAPVEQNF